MYLATPTTLKIVKDQNDNIIEEGGVKIDLSADRVIYLNSGAEDIVSNIEFFMGTLGDDQFIGSALHSTNIDATYKYDIQAFNPTAGKDEIFGAETVDDINNPGQVIDVQTVVTYDGMQGGQGAIFIWMAVQLQHTQPKAEMKFHLQKLMILLVNIGMQPLGLVMVGYLQMSGYIK